MNGFGVAFFGLWFITAVVLFATAVATGDVTFAAFVVVAVAFMWWRLTH